MTVLLDILRQFQEGILHIIYNFRFQNPCEREWLDFEQIRDTMQT